MLLETVKQLKWVDIFAIILLFRITYIASKNGIFITFFKLLGTLLAVYLSLHFYTRLADYIQMRLPAGIIIPLELWDFLAFFFLAILGYLVFVVLRETFFRFIKAETVSFLNRWGSAILGISRGLILVSLIIFLLSIPVVDYFRNSVRDSFLGRRLIKVSTDTYIFLWGGFVAKFMPNDEFNKVVLEVQDEILKK